MRTFLTGLAATLLPATAALAADDVTLQLKWVTQAQFAGYYVALAKGFYAAEGVDMTILRGGPGEPPSRLMAEGKAQFGTFFLATALLKRAEGLPLVNLAQFVPHSTQLLIAKKADGIEKPADLAGGKVSLWGPEFQLAARTFFKRYGLTVEPVPQGFTVDLFLRGGVAACSAMRYNEYHAIINAGLDPEELTVFDLAAHGQDLPEDGLYTLQRVLEADPELCRSVARASVRGWEYAFAHPEAALDVVMSHVSAAHLPTNRMHQKWMLESLRQAMTGPGDPLGTLTRPRYQAAAKALSAAGLVADAPPYEEFHVRLP